MSLGGGFGGARVSRGWGVGSAEHARHLNLSLKNPKHPARSQVDRGCGAVCEEMVTRGSGSSVSGRCMVWDLYFFVWGFWSRLECGRFVLVCRPFLGEGLRIDGDCNIPTRLLLLR